MEWLTQNWLFVIGAIGVFLLMRRGGMSCGHSNRHHHGGDSGHDGHHAGPDHEHHEQQSESVPAGAAQQAVDPVSGKQVNPSSAVSALHHGVPVFFESRESRDRFEASPEQFPIAQAAPPAERQRRRGGC